MNKLKKYGKQVIGLTLSAALVITGVYCFIFSSDSKDNPFTLGSLTVRLHVDDQYTTKNDEEILVEDAKVVNMSLSEKYDELSADADNEITLYDASGNTVTAIADAASISVKLNDIDTTYKASDDGTYCVETNGINDFAEGVLPGDEISMSPYMENTTEKSSCHAVIVVKTPTLSADDCFVGSDGVLANAGDLLSVKIQAYGIQRGYGDINVNDEKYKDDGEQLIKDVWAKFKNNALPIARTMNDRINFIQPADANEDWTFIEMYKGNDDYNYYVYGYTKLLAGGDTTSVALDNVTITGYITKEFTSPTATNVSVNNGSNSTKPQGVSYEWISSYGLNTTDNEEYQLSSSAKLTVVKDDNGYFQFQIVLNDGNIIATDYYPSLNTSSAYSNVGSDNMDGNWSRMWQYILNTSYRTATQLKYALPCAAYGMQGSSSSSNAFGTSRYNSSFETVGIPITVTTTSGGAVSDPQLATTVLPIDTVMIKQSDGTYVSYKLTTPTASATKVTMASNSATFYDGSYITWLENCINTGYLLGDYSWLI